MQDSLICNKQAHNLAKKKNLLKVKKISYSFLRKRSISSLNKIVAFVDKKNAIKEN